MIYVHHRINTTEQLRKIEDLDTGCEIDLRSNVEKPGKLHLAHDPWTAGEDFEMWLKEYRLRGPLILNTKEDSLETLTLEILKRHGVENYFFLDTTVPTLHRWTSQGLRHFAVRFSRYEPVEFIRAFEGKLDWVWVDCFDALPMNVDAIVNDLKKFKVCLVSPEMQGGSIERLGDFAKLFAVANAVCTKNVSAWRAHFGE